MKTVEEIDELRQVICDYYAESAVHFWGGGDLPCQAFSFTERDKSGRYASILMVYNIYLLYFHFSFCFIFNFFAKNCCRWLRLSVANNA